MHLLITLLILVAVIFLLVERFKPNIMLYMRNDQELPHHEPLKFHYGEDAGFDLTCAEHVHIPPMSMSNGESVSAINIKTNISIKLPDGYWGLILSRSSNLKRYGIQIQPAVIDNGYTGELFLQVWNISNKTVDIPVGTRIAQIILIPIVDAKTRFVRNLPSTSRGVGGFGSTGK
jgi:dUTP pyrophosphatase